MNTKKTKSRNGRSVNQAFSLGSQSSLGNKMNGLLTGGKSVLTSQAIEGQDQDS